MSDLPPLQPPALRWAGYLGCACLAAIALAGAVASWVAVIRYASCR